LKLDGERVREGRERLALSIENVSATARVSPHTWVRAEHGEEIRPSSVRRIAEALGVEPRQLMGEPALLGKAEAPPSPETAGDERRAVSDSGAPSALTLEDVRRVLEEHVGTSWIALPPAEWEGWWRGIPHEEARKRRAQIIEEWAFLTPQFAALEQGKPSLLPRRLGPGGVFLRLWMRANFEAPESVPVRTEEPEQAFKRRQWEEQPLEWTSVEYPQAEDAPDKASGAEAG
jgi:transcriptional regulator with XRE-family HTH domain